MTHQDFLELLTEKGIELYRDMPWREDTRPYYVLVSELMLQQTQVGRVVPKFNDFIKKFPDEIALAHASLADVLKAWQGLGYNRRAKYLHEAARKIVEAGKFPDIEKDLMALPGIGKNTAGAILAYSYNYPSVFVETNIRTVYIHHFFNNEFTLDDKKIVAKLIETLDHENPRIFYQSLMDYGSWLKSQGIRNNASSKHYKKQAPLKGSVREVRGQLIRLLADGDKTISEIELLYKNDARLASALSGLEKDGLIKNNGVVLHLTN